MRKSYKKIIFIESLMVIVMLFNIIKLRALTNFLLLSLIIINYIFFIIYVGKEKKHFRYTKDITMLVIIYTILLLLITYIFGMLSGFIKSPNYWNIDGLITFIIPTIGIIVFTELFRGDILIKSELSKPLIVLCVFTFVLLDISIKVNSSTFSNAYNVLFFIAYYLLPSIAKNIFCTYISLHVGNIAAIVYRIIIECYTFVVPIYPDFGDYLNCMVRMIIPVTLLFLISRKVKKESLVDVELNYHKKYITVKNALAIIFIFCCIYFTSGKFKYFSLAIGSGSMYPNIKKGDMVIVKRLSEEDKKNIKIGDILVHNKKNVVVVHRIIDIYKNGDIIIAYTKGDANEGKDSYPIDTSMMIGVVINNIPLIGYPTVYINEKLS